MSQPLPTTPRDIINLALKTANVVGVGQSSLPEDINDCFNMLNMMIAQWQRRRYMVYNLKTVSITATGATSYTIGLGQQFNTERPAKIEAAFIRMQGGSNLPVDYPLQVLRAKEDYDRISIKTLNAFPQYVFYDSTFPVGNVFVWPVPNNQYQIFLTVMTQLQAFQNLSEVIVMPNEYLDAMHWNLADRILTIYGLPENPKITRYAEVSMRAIMENNSQIPLLHMPVALRGKSGAYNIYGDFYVGSAG
jgi:hypothetical protein